MSCIESRKQQIKSTKQLPKKEEKVKWSKNSILLIIVFGVAFLFFVLASTFNFEISNIFNSKNKADFRTVNATVYFYEPKSILIQSEYGESNKIVGYLVRYRFKANEKIYDHEETLSANTKSDFLIHIISNLNSDSFLVKYNISSPDDAYLIQNGVGK